MSSWFSLHLKIHIPFSWWIMNFCYTKKIPRQTSDPKPMWEPPTLKQVLANQRGPRQLQCPLGRTSLATACKGADLQRASQFQPRLHWDRLSGVQTATVSLLAATPISWRKKDWRARSQPAANARKTDEPAHCGRSFTGIHRVRHAFELQPFSGPTTPYRLLHPLPVCLPAYSSVYSSPNSNK
jgi:hypothetical protein